MTTPSQPVFEQDTREQAQPRSGRTTSRQKSELDPVIKVLTSATFVRGVFGILSKALK